jgi:putative transcriptional regulator (Ypuh-like)
MAVWSSHLNRCSSQPITRAEISNIRATDSSGVIETLLARRLIEDDPRFREPRTPVVPGDHRRLPAVTWSGLARRTAAATCAVSVRHIWAVR